MFLTVKISRFSGNKDTHLYLICVFVCAFVALSFKNRPVFGASTAVVTVIDFKGNFVGRKSVAAIADLSKLTAQGLTSTGYMEPEGIKIFDGILYCGFASKSTDDVRRVAVLQYDLRKN